MCRTTFIRVGCTLLLALLLPAAIAVGAEPAATQPGPTTAPPPDDGTVGVVVTPLETIGGNRDTLGELARGIEKSIAQDLSRSRRFRVLQGGAVPANRDAVIANGKVFGADFAVSGSIQESEGRVRVTGEVLDVARAEPAGSFKVTGDSRDVFDLQDQVAARVRLHLMRATALAQEPRDDAAADSEPAAEVPPSKPLRARVRSIDPDWLTPPDNPGDPNADAMAYRYNYASPYDYWSSGYWSIPYGYGNYYGLGYSPGRLGYGLGYGYGGYHYAYYRPWRPIYQYRYNDYSSRGIYDRRTYDGFGPRVLHNFSGPVPMRNYNAPMQRNYNAPMQRNFNAPVQRNYNAPAPGARR